MFRRWQFRSSKNSSLLNKIQEQFIKVKKISQDDLLDDDDRLIDRSPDDMGSQDNDLDDELDSDDDMEGTVTSEGERIIYPWMKKIHVAGVGEFTNIYSHKDSALSLSLY